MSIPPKRSTPYVSNGEFVSSPPLSVRISQTVNSAYNFFGLYLRTLLSLDPYGAGLTSQFNTHVRANGASAGYSGQRLGANRSGGWFGGSSSGSGRPGNAPPARRMGTVNDVRGPECGSCK